ncbi:Protein LURP-one-related 17 [Linum grandiflorum]
MLFNLKSWSKTVYDEEFDEPDAAPEQVLLPQKKLQVVAEEEPPPESTSGTSDADDGVVRGGWSTSLTVWRKSLVMNCNGFTVINADGDLVYRVDNYCGRPEEITLMDAAGNSVLTLLHHTKRLGLVDSWLVYDGDAEAAVGGNIPATGETVKYVPKKPIWCVKKQKNLLLQGSNGNSVLAYVYRGSSGKREYSYAIEGSYGQRSCKVVEYESRKEVAEIRRKEAAVGGVSFGAEVFVLSVQTGFDSGFAMALVLLLDQMFS